MVDVSQDRKSFLAFITLVVLTAFLPFYSADYPLFTGLLALIWGFFGLFRLVYLTHYQNSDIPQFLNLPIQILFGSSKQEQQKRKLILQRLAQPDVLLWLVGAIIYILQMAYYQLYVYGPTDATTRLPYAMITQLAMSGITVTMIFLALSYSQKRRYIKIAAYAFAPFIMLAYLLSVIVSLNTNIVALSFYGIRYDQFGLIGAVGVYVLALPPAAMFVKVLFNARRRFLKPFMGLLGLIGLLLIDRLIVPSEWSNACSFVLLGATAMLWGHTVRYRL